MLLIITMNNNLSRTLTTCEALNKEFECSAQVFQKLMYANNSGAAEPRSVVAMKKDMQTQTPEKGEHETVEKASVCTKATLKDSES